MAAGFLPKVAEVAQRHPNLKLILDHLGRPSGGTASQPDLWANLPEVVALARYPNVAMKAAQRVGEMARGERGVLGPPGKAGYARRA